MNPVTLSPLTLRRSGERGKTQLDWLDSYHTFSFGGYHDPAHMGFGVLRVINDDIVAPGGGFGMHGHRDMEIITVVLSGTLQHQDSLGNGSTITPGEVQRMTAGAGIRHSEFNASQTEPVHLLQIWILPEAEGLEPGYEQRCFDPKPNQWRLIASSDAREGSVRVHQDVLVFQGTLSVGGTLPVSLTPGRQAWLHVATGNLTLDGTPIHAGDGIALAAHAGETGPYLLEAPGTVQPSHVLLFEMPA